MRVVGGMRGSGVGEAAAAPGAEAVVTAEQAACCDGRGAGGRAAVGGNAPAAKAGGGNVVAGADADRGIARIADMGREAVEAEEPDSTQAGQMFRHSFDGRTVWLVTSRFVAKEGYWGDGCRAYDLDAPAAPPREVIDGWVGKAPTGVQANGTATKRLWEPWQTGVSLEITYVPRGHPLGSSYGIQGPNRAHVAPQSKIIPPFCTEVRSGPNWQGPGT